MKITIGTNPINLPTAVNVDMQGGAIVFGDDTNIMLLFAYQLKPGESVIKTAPGEYLVEEQ